MASRRARPHTPAVLRFVGAFVFIACAIGACASPQARYKFLSFFLDGVPDPSAQAAVVSADAGPAERARLRTGGSTHRPVQEHRCEPCHGFSRGEVRMRGFTGVDMSAITTAWKSCRTCHSGSEEMRPEAVVLHEGRWLHGPVAVGQCADCHVGHRSSHAHLLRDARVEAACLNCHTDLPPRSGSMAPLDCSECHDPHGAEDPSQLFLKGGVAEVCAGCHAVDAESRPWLHGPVAVGACATCHDAHGLPGSVKHVRRPIRPVCLSCHQATDLSRAPHAADSTEECDTCHDPHAASSPDDRLLRRREAETLLHGSAFLPALKSRSAKRREEEAAMPRSGEATLPPTDKDE